MKFRCVDGTAAVGIIAEKRKQYCGKRETESREQLEKMVGYLQK